MKTLKSIPLEKYDDTEFVYNFLNENETIGDEDAEYNGLWHVHWRSSLDNNKVILQIKSILATQYVTKIYFWIENEEVTKNSPSYPNLMQFKDFIEIKIFDKKIIYSAPGKSGVNKWVGFYYDEQQSDVRYKTDIFKPVILSIYGGMYTDLDTLMLRDVRDIKVKNWSSRWGNADFMECCILKLEKGSLVYQNLFLNDPRNPQCFLNLKNELPQAFNYKYDNIDVTSLPSTFFDIIWINKDTELSFFPINESYKFFEETNKEITMDNFFKGCFSYHWHNYWNNPELKKSFAGRLNEDLDRIIEEKYNIKPNKIFTQ